MTVELRIS